MRHESLMLEVSHHKIGLCTPREAVIKVTAISKHTHSVVLSTAAQLNAIFAGNK